MRPKTIVLALLLFTGLNVFLALNRHSHSAPLSYHGELWADRGGYFVYLPAALVYGFDARAFPTGLDALTGRGFALDTARGLVVTKYTSGVALLQCPIYLAGHAMAHLLGLANEPYGPVDRCIVDVAASLYLSLGLLLLFQVLRRRHDDRLVAWCLLALYGGSNLYFYTIGDPGMSHVYSFFLFALLLFLFDRWSQGSRSAWLQAAIGITAGWIILVRPTNAVFLLAVPFAGADCMQAGWQRACSLSPHRTPLVALGALLIWAPQMAYWRHTFGSAITWPYVNEGFTHWAEPRLLEFWFAPQNGLLSYTPFYGLVVVAALSTWRSGDRATGAASLLAMLAVSYLGASWWVWHFGCGFGSRTMVEYLALFALPVAAWARLALERWGRVVPITVFVVLAAYNLKLVYSHGDCWFHGTWDWDAFGSMVLGPTK